MRIRRKRLLQQRYIGLFLWGLPSLVLAADGTTQIDTVLQNLLNYLTSAPARILAGIAIVGIGYGTLKLGKIPKETAISVVIGIGIIFGGSTIMKMLMGQ